MKQANNLETALHLGSQGMAVFPCHAGGNRAKQPLVKWRDESTCDSNKIKAWWQRWPEAGIGIDLAKCGMIVIDCDRHNKDNGVDAICSLAHEQGYDLDSAPLVATPNKGMHIWFRQPGGKAYGNRRGNLPAGVDVRGNGGYVIAPGTVMQDGREYELTGDIKYAPVLPGWLDDIINAEKSGPATRPPHPVFRPDKAQFEEIEDLLYHIDPDCHYEDWLAALMAVHNETGGSMAGLALVDNWSSGGRKYKGNRETQAKWRSFRRSGTTRASLAHLAEKYGADLSEIAIRHMPPLDMAECERINAMLLESLQRRKRQKQPAALPDGTTYNPDTGEIIDDKNESDADTEDLRLDYPPGLVGEIAKWITDTARYPQPELAIGAALAIIGTVAGRQFAGPTRSGTHLYVLGLAPTGRGKDHALQQISRIMSACGLGHHIGPSEFISMPSVINFLSRKPLSVCLMDEFGGFMKRINSRRASGFENAISKVIRTLWSSSFSPFITPEWAQKQSEIIYAPAITIYGASTYEQFYSAMEGSSLEDGTLNRFFLVEGRKSVKQKEPAIDALDVPKSITDKLRRVYFTAGEMATTVRNDSHADIVRAGNMVEMCWCPDGAFQQYQEFSGEIDSIMTRNPELSSFYARTVETALRIATIIAIGRLEARQVNKIDMEHGILFSRRSAQFMEKGAHDYMAENQYQADTQKVMRRIREKGGRISGRDLLRSLQNTIRTRDLKEILDSLCQAEKIQREDIKTKGRSSFIYKIIK